MLAGTPLIAHKAILKPEAVACGASDFHYFFFNGRDSPYAVVSPASRVARSTR